MTSILVVYGTGEGQTAKVADYVDSVLTERGHEVTTLPVGAASDVAVDDFDAVVVGSPVNNRRHLPAVVEFVEENRAALADRPSAFFQLSFASIVPSAWAREGAREFVDDLVERTGWRPDRVGLFAGAVRYTQYDRLTRALFRLVSTLTTGDTDTDRDYEYTDWDEVEGFASEFASFVEAERERRPAATRGDSRTAGSRWRRAAVAALVGVGLAAVAYRSVSRRYGSC
jgi:menaquinone-dependent protoporphyrinogen oxidase